MVFWTPMEDKYIYISIYNMQLFFYGKFVGKHTPLIRHGMLGGVFSVPINNIKHVNKVAPTSYKWSEN